MVNHKILHAALTSILIIGGVAPAFAQGILDMMKEDAERRAEHKAIMDAEHPKEAQTAAVPAANTTSTQTQTAPVSSQTPPSTPTAPATPAPASAQ